MTRRPLFVFAILVLLGGIAGGTYLLQRPPAFDLVRRPSADASLAWPLNYFWVWDARRPAVEKGESIAFEVRCKTLPGIDTGGYQQSFNTGSRPSNTTETADFRAVTAGHGGFEQFDPDNRLPITVTLQLIDPVQHESTTQPTAKRILLGNINIGGSGTRMNATQSLPLDGTVRQWQTFTDTNWAGPELLVARFIIEKEQKAYLFEAVIYRSR